MHPERAARPGLATFAGPAPAVALAVALAAGCGKSNPAPSPAPAISTPATSAAAVPVQPVTASEQEGWEEGPAALEKALAARVPVLLFVTSEWCPPCKALEANLLSKPAFRDATKGLVRVRVDGDAEGAQTVAERFEARAYPTLLLLSPEGEELFRAHHAVSLEELSPALAAAAAAGSGFKKALARLGEGGAAPADCAFFAAVDWGPASGVTLSTPERLTHLRRAFEQCKDAPAATRALLAAHLLGLAAVADTTADSALPGASVKGMEAALLDAVFGSEESAWAARTLVTTWATPVVSWVLEAERGPRFAALRDRWLRAAAAIRARPGAPLDMRLLGYNAVLDFHRLERGAAPLDPALCAEIEAAVDRVEPLARTAAERHSVVPNAAYLLRSVGRGERARALLLAEVAKVDAPSYSRPCRNGLLPTATRTRPAASPATPSRGRGAARRACNGW
jgi:thiol-disulfide isomerase/thioredoxin